MENRGYTSWGNFFKHITNALIIRDVNVDFYCIIYLRAYISSL